MTAPLVAPRNPRASGRKRCFDHCHSVATAPPPDGAVIPTRVHKGQFRRARLVQFYVWTVLAKVVRFWQMRFAPLVRFAAPP